MFNFVNKVKLIGRILKASSVPNIYTTPSVSIALGGSPRFTTYSNKTILENEYYLNPVFSAIADLRANYMSNAIFKVRNIKTGEVISFKDYKENRMNDNPILKNMFNIIRNPNPLQSTKEYIAIQNIMKDVFGNQFTYGNFVGKKYDIKSISSMWAVWPQYIYPVYNVNGIKIFGALDLKDIYEGWEFRWGGYNKKFNTDEILHRKDVNIKLNKPEDIILGESKLISLQYPLSNIKIAYESRNVIAQERGMRGIISSGESDANGSISLGADDKKLLQEEFKGKDGYGFKADQNQFLITGRAINYTSIDQDVKKLGLLDEIASDAMVICNKYGVPEVLVKLYIQGATFENQNIAERRMYQNTTIPDMNDWIEDMNNWLNTREYNYEWIVSFDHIAVLQEDEKNKSIVNLNNSNMYKELFFSGGCTYNSWLKAIGEEQLKDSWANLRITEMQKNEIAIITNNLNLLKNDGNA